MDHEEIAAAIRDAIAPYPDATTAYRASGLHPAFPPEAEPRDGPRRLLMAACEEFFRVGYHGASTRDIAAAAGMSPTAMYAHYSSKQAMLLKLCIFGSGSALEALRRAADPEKAPIQRLRSAVYAFAHWHAENHVLGRVAQWDFSALEESSREVVASLRRETDATMRAVLVSGIETGDFVVPDLAGTTLAILSLSIDILRWFPSRTIHSPEAIASTYVALAEAMVVPRRS